MKEGEKHIRRKSIELNQELDISQQLRSLADQMEAREDKPLCFGICFVWLKPNEWDTQGLIPGDKSVTETIVKFFQTALDKYFIPIPDSPRRDQGPH